MANRSKGDWSGSRRIQMEINHEMTPLEREVVAMAKEMGLGEG